jgi:hypothetical protein
MKKITLFLGIILVGLVTFSGCKKIDPVTPDPSSMDKLTVSESFDWKTSRTITLHLTGYASNLANIASPSGASYDKIFLIQNERTTVQVTIPTYETMIHLLYMGQDVALEVGSSEIEYVFN